MLNENAQKWVAALRSGKYNQTKATLNDADGYCCLGVACDLYEKQTGNKLPRNEEGFYDDCALLGEFKVVSDWLGFHYKFGNGSYEDDDTGMTLCLAEHNDFGYDFNRIADIIESKPCNLFNGRV